MRLRTQIPRSVLHTGLHFHDRRVTVAPFKLGVPQQAKQVGLSPVVAITETADGFLTPLTYARRALLFLMRDGDDENV